MEKTKQIAKNWQELNEIKPPIISLIGSYGKGKSLFCELAYKAYNKNENSKLIFENGKYTHPTTISQKTVKPHTTVPVSYKVNNYILLDLPALCLNSQAQKGNKLQSALHMYFFTTKIINSSHIFVIDQVSIRPPYLGLKKVLFSIFDDLQNTNDQQFLESIGFIITKNFKLDVGKNNIISRIQSFGQSLEVDHPYRNTVLNLYEKLQKNKQVFLVPKYLGNEKDLQIVLAITLELQKIPVSSKKLKAQLFQPNQPELIEINSLITKIAHLLAYMLNIVILLQQESINTQKLNKFKVEELQNEHLNIQYYTISLQQFNTLKTTVNSFEYCLNYISKLTLICKNKKQLSQYEQMQLMKKTFIHLQFQQLDRQVWLSFSELFEKTSIFCSIATLNLHPIIQSIDKNVNYFEKNFFDKKLKQNFKSGQKKQIYQKIHQYLSGLQKIDDKQKNYKMLSLLYISRQEKPLQGLTNLLNSHHQFQNLSNANNLVYQWLHVAGDIAFKIRSFQKSFEFFQKIKSFSDIKKIFKMYMKIQQKKNWNFIEKYIKFLCNNLNMFEYALNFIYSFTLTSDNFTETQDKLNQLEQFIKKQYFKFINQKEESKVYFTAKIEIGNSDLEAINQLIEILQKTNDLQL